MEELIKNAEKKDNQMVIKKMVKVVEEIDTVVELPFYSKAGDKLYKVVSNDLVIEVYLNDKRKGIEHSDFVNFAFSAHTTPLSEEEFNTSYIEVLSKINKEFSKLG